MNEREALRLALEALEKLDRVMKRSPDTDKAITAIKQALEQPEPEPVAFYVYKPALPRGHLGNVSDGDLPWVYDQDPSSGYSARMLVCTSPPKREPLTDDEFISMVDSAGLVVDPTLAFEIKEMVEDAHGIKE